MAPETLPEWLAGRMHRHQARSHRNAVWVTAAGAVAAAMLAALGWWMASAASTAKPARARTLPESIATVVEALPSPLATRSEEGPREPIKGDLRTAKGRLTITVVDAKTRELLENAWVALPIPLEPPLTEAAEKDPAQAAAALDTAFELRGYASNPVVIDAFWHRAFIVAGAAGGWLTTTAEAWLLPSQPDVDLVIPLERGGSIEVVARDRETRAPVDGVAMAVRLDAEDRAVEPLFREFAQKVVVKDPMAAGASSDEAAHGHSHDPAPPPERVAVFPSLPPQDQDGRLLRRSPDSLAGALEQLRLRPGDGWFAHEFAGGLSRRYAEVKGGTHRFEGLATGDRWAVMFWPSSLHSHGAATGLSVEDRRTTTVPLELAAVNVLTGTVRWADGAPVAGAEVEAFTAANPSSSDSSAVTAITDRSGRFELPVNRWQFLVLAHLDRDRDGEFGVSFGTFEHVTFGECAGERRSIDLVLSRNERDSTGRPDVLRGRVVKPDGTPASGASVSGGIYGPRCRTDAEGRFAMFGGFGALQFALAEVDRAERWMETGFRSVANHREARPEGGWRSMTGVRDFRVADLARGEELVIPLEE